MTYKVRHKRRKEFDIEFIIQPVTEDGKLLDGYLWEVMMLHDDWDKFFDRKHDGKKEVYMTNCLIHWPPYKTKYFHSEQNVVRSIDFIIRRWQEYHDSVAEVIEIRENSKLLSKCLAKEP